MAKTAAVAMCLGLLALAMVADVHAAGCVITSLLPCLEAGKTGAFPKDDCCSAVNALGQGPGGPGCLCSLVTSPTAKSQGVNFDYAMSIPLKCKLPIPKGETCDNKRVPGS